MKHVKRGKLWGWKTGAAPATSRSTTWRSTVELHPPSLKIISFYFWSLNFDGANFLRNFCFKNYF